MTFQDFNQQTPTLYGFVNFAETRHDKGGQKIGAFICEQNRYTGVYDYRYYTLYEKNGKTCKRRGNYSIFRQRAFELLLTGQLGFDIEMGKKENYV